METIDIIVWCIVSVAWFFGSLYYAVAVKVENPDASVMLPSLSALFSPLIALVLVELLMILVPLVLIIYAANRLISTIANKLRQETKESTQ